VGLIKPGWPLTWCSFLQPGPYLARPHTPIGPGLCDYLWRQPPRELRLKSPKTEAKLHKPSLEGYTLSELGVIW
jgi:hypothetical protein